MSLTVYNRNNFDFTREYMFMGEKLNVARFDKQRYPLFENINRRMISLYWVPEEISMMEDIRDWNDNMSEGEKHIFTANLKYQTFLDSVQGRSPTQVLLPMASLPEIEGCIETWSFFETIHSRSYSHIIRNVYTDPSVVFDGIMVTPEILKRAETVTSAYEELYNAYMKFELGADTTITRRQIKEKLHDCMVAVNVLESVRFYASFACTLAFHKQNKMRGTGNIITLIARDEAEHVNLTRQIYRHWLLGQDDPEMKAICLERKHVVERLFEEAREQEKEWVEYLFQKGSMRGLNDKILVQYLDYITERAMKGMSLDVQLKTQHPIPWIEDYFSSSGRQNAPQETENTAYLVGAVNSDLDDDDFSDIFGDD